MVHAFESFKFSPEEFGMRLFGLSSSLVSKYNCKRQPNNYKYTYFILAQSEFDEDTHRLYVLHLKNRDGLHSIVAEFLNRIRQLMTNDKEEIEKNGDVSKWISCGLLELSHHMLYQPSTLALIGEINPASLENDFSTFDKNFHYFFIPFPQWIYSWFFSPVLQARTRLNESWLKNPEPLKASDFHRDRIALLSSYSQWISKQDYGAFLTGFMWASLGNTIPGVFWSLFYILRDKQALETIKQEMDTHILDDNWIQPEQLDACVYLESAINETLRLVDKLKFIYKTDGQLLSNLMKLWHGLVLLVIMMIGCFQTPISSFSIDFSIGKLTLFLVICRLELVKVFVRDDFLQNMKSKHALLYFYDIWNTN